MQSLQDSITFLKNGVEYYNTKDRHIYPKNEEQKYQYIYYLHNPDNYHIVHYCLIDRKNKQKAIKEIEENYDREWKQLDSDNIKKVEEVKVNTEIDIAIDDNTLIYDIEIYTDENGKHVPYAVASLNLNLFKGCAREHIRGEEGKLVENLPEKQMERLLEKHIKVFIGEDCIKQFFEYLGDSYYSSLILVAHNEAGFDSEIIIENIPIHTPPVKKGSKLLNVKIKNPYKVKNGKNGIKELKA